MHFLSNLGMGFGIVLTPQNFLFCLIGATVGTMVGVLPGLGPVTTIAMLLPITFHIPAVASLIMLCGIYYGSHHAGSTTAIMLNMPGEPSSVVICLDGHPMARLGRAGVALCIAAIGSFAAGIVGAVIIALFSPLLAEVVTKFASPEYACTVVLALVVASALSGKSMLITIGMSLLGLLLGCIGTDVATGVVRFNFGVPDLQGGINLVAVAVGLFAFSETASQVAGTAGARAASARLSTLIPGWADLKAAAVPILRGCTIGSLVGIFPGTGPLLASYASYALEKRIARDPERFGQGAIEGVAGPEAANNAATLTHMIPLLTLGIPAGAANALLLSALLIQGITPGPDLLTQRPDLFWGVIASMLVGNVMLLILNLPMVGIWIRLLMIPYRLLYPAILAFCCIGVYSVNNSPFDVLLAGGIGATGYLFRKLDCNPAPTILGLVLGPLLEENFRRSMQLSRGDPLIFVERPICVFLLALSAILVVLLTRVMTRREGGAGAPSDGEIAAAK